MALQEPVSPPPLISRRVRGGVVGVQLPVGGDMPPNIGVMLGGADVVFCDKDADSGIAAWVGPGAVVEFVPINDGRGWSRPASLDRARRLAGDGWRVVWVASAGIELPSDFARAEGSIDAGVPELAPLAASAPHRLATAFNGLAG